VARSLLLDGVEGKEAMTRPVVALAAVLALAACSTTPGEPTENGRPPMPDIARSGGVNRAAGTAVPMAIGCRALAVARALTRSVGVGQLSSACSAASRL
jgi:hypothetical protein